MKSEEAAFSALTHCCCRKCCPLFSLLRSLCSLHPRFVVMYQLLYRRSYLRTGWWNTLFPHIKIALIYNRNPSTCVINYIFIKLHFIWNKPKNVRTFSVPISCMYKVLNQRQIVLQKCVGENVRSIRTPKKANVIWWNYHGTYYVWYVICSNIGVKGVKFYECEIPTACI